MKGNLVLNLFLWDQFALFEEVVTLAALLLPLMHIVGIAIFNSPVVKVFRIVSLQRCKGRQFARLSAQVVEHGHSGRRIRPSLREGQSRHDVHR